MKSRTGHVVTLGGCPISFASKLQTEMAASALATAMRAFVSMCHAHSELCLNFGFNLTDNDSVVKSKVFEDNNGCISACTAPKMTPRTKHIAVKCHFVRNCFNMDPTLNCPARHPFVLEKTETDKQKADLFTKGFNEEKFAVLRKLLCGW